MTRVRLIEGLRDEAKAMEDVGALHLTYTLLACLARIAAREGPRIEGLVVVQQARAARHLGHLDVAQNLYDRATELARTVDDGELRARAALGKGTIAATRGNYPVARRAYRQALTAACDAGRLDVASMANQGLMVTAATAGDTESALRFGWDAFRDAAGDAAREAEILLNLAAVCVDTHQYRGALHSYLVALQRTNAPRLVIPALGSAMRVAARLGDRTQASSIEERLVSELERDTFPFERTSARLDLAEAYGLLGRDDEAAQALNRAECDARHHGFFELTYRAEAMPAALAAARKEHAARKVTMLPAPTPSTRRVLYELETLSQSATAGV